MDESRLTYLFEQYESDQASDEELDELFAIITNEANNTALLSYLEHSIRETTPDQLPDIEKWRPVIAKIIASQTSRRINRWWRYAAAAVITIAVGFVVHYVSIPKKEEAPVVSKQTAPVHDVAAPASANAFVTLADGTTIVLDSVSNGAFAKQGSAQLVKLADGAIAYQGAGGKVVYNTLHNPRGSKVVNLVLADGSTVWLNAASSVTYPTGFTGDRRAVQITGEAYFEVAKSKIPFIVRKGDMQIQVLGTHFNVNAYDNENNIKVTLLEGSVQVDAGNTNKPVKLRPGQQAEVYTNTMRLVDKIDTSRIMAWKNGYFDFTNTDLPNMMRQLERWYDITVAYQGQIPHIIFKGQMDRGVRLTDVIRFLNAFGVNARLEGRTLIVYGS